jgi:hypothetical protein
MNFKKLMFLSITIGLVGACGSAWGMKTDNGSLSDSIDTIGLTGMSGSACNMKTDNKSPEAYGSICNMKTDNGSLSDSIDTIGLKGASGSILAVETDSVLPSRITQEQENNLNNAFEKLKSIRTQPEILAYTTKYNNFCRWINIISFLKEISSAAIEPTVGIGLGLGLFGYIATNLDTRALLANLSDGVTYVSFFTLLSWIVSSGVMNTLTKKFKTHCKKSSMPDSLHKAHDEIDSCLESIQKSILPTNNEKKLLSQFVNRERQTLASLYNNWKKPGEPIQRCELSCYSKSGKKIVTLYEPEN